MKASWLIYLHFHSYLNLKLSSAYVYLIQPFLTMYFLSDQLYLIRLQTTKIVCCTRCHAELEINLMKYISATKYLFKPLQYRYKQNFENILRRKYEQRNDGDVFFLHRKRNDDKHTWDKLATVVEGAERSQKSTITQIISF